MSTHIKLEATLPGGTRIAIEASGTDLSTVRENVRRMLDDAIAAVRRESPKLLTNAQMVQQLLQRQFIEKPPLDSIGRQPAKSLVLPPDSW